MRRIRLFSTVFPVTDSARRAEYAECLARNLRCNALDEVHLFAEGEVELPEHSKVSHRTIGGRPCYADYLAWIGELAAPDDVSIVANADIYFDDRVGALKRLSLDSRSVMALARWEAGGQADPVLNDRNDSQDAWVFVGVPSGIFGDFPVGVPRCDNRFAKEIELAGYRLTNPAFSVRSYHLHNGIREEYSVSGGEGFVPGPYGYVWPHNIMSLPRILAHNWQHADARIEWRFDRRLWSRRLKLHLLDRVRSGSARGNP